MNNKIKAFPVGGLEGMDLRDYFATSIIRSLITPEDIMATSAQNELKKYSRMVSKTAYFIADEMLEMRK